MNYELLLWLKPDLGADQVKKEIQGLEEFLGSAENSKFLIENLGRQKLAFLAKRFREGVKLMVNFEAEPSKIKELPNYLKMNENVLRYLMTKVPSTKSQIPKAKNQKTNASL